MNKICGMNSEYECNVIRQYQIKEKYWKNTEALNNTTNKIK